MHVKWNITTNKLWPGKNKGTDDLKGRDLRSKKKKRGFNNFLRLEQCDAFCRGQHIKQLKHVMQVLTSNMWKFWILLSVCRLHHDLFLLLCFIPAILLRNPHIQGRHSALCTLFTKLLSHWVFKTMFILSYLTVYSDYIFPIILSCLPVESPYPINPLSTLSIISM